jgi:hypothetical protein
MDSSLFRFFVPFIEPDPALAMFAFWLSLRGAEYLTRWPCSRKKRPA